jgi:hypothetical protein
LQNGWFQGNINKIIKSDGMGCSKIAGKSELFDFLRVFIVAWNLSSLFPVCRLELHLREKNLP